MESAERTRLLLLALTTAACGDAATARPPAVVRDSGGIAIVENRAPDDVATHVVTGPVLEIGAVAGAEEYELHDVRAVVGLSDGGVAIANGSAEIRWYDRSGSFRQRAGRQGGGPGEFLGIRYMRGLRGDSLLVFDQTQRRVSVFAPDGALVRDEVLHLDDERPATVAGALRDGTLLTRTVLEMPVTATPLYRPRQAFAVLRADTVVPLRPYPGPESSLHVSGEGGGINSVFVSVLPFGRAGHAAAGSDQFFIGSSDSFQIDVWDATGRLVRIIRVARPDAPVTEELRQAYIDAEVERRRQVFAARGRAFEEGESRRELQAQPHAPAVPAYGALLATADGGLWVRDFTLPGTDEAPRRWTIFDDAGGLRGSIDMPPRFTPMYVDGSLVTGVYRDSMDVTYVRVYSFGSTRSSLPPRPAAGSSRAADPDDALPVRVAGTRHLAPA